MVLRGIDRVLDVGRPNDPVVVVDEMELNWCVHRGGAVLIVDDVLPPADNDRSAGGAEQSEGNLVAHHSRRDKDRRLFAEALRELRLEFVDGGVLAASIIADDGVGHGPTHRRRWRGHRVGSEVNEVTHGRGTLSPAAYGGGVPATNLDELLALAYRLATAAGVLVCEAISNGQMHIATKSTATDLVTEMDRAAETLIVEGIRAARPADSVVAEEGSEAAGSSGVRWFVDPIDGTTNYVYGLPGFGISVGAADEAGLAVGVVVDPVHGNTYTATRGSGAFRNGHAIRASSRNDLASALVSTGFSYETARRFEQAKVLLRLLPTVRDIRRLGAASVDLCNVASGRVDAYYERGLHDWDKAAGILIATEAGALVDDRSSGLVVAAAPGIFTELRDLLVNAGADSA